jgi:hypothetical protein
MWAVRALLPPEAAQIHYFFCSAMISARLNASKRTVVLVYI